MTPAPAADGTAKGPRVLVCGWAGAGNLGDELLTEAIIERLRSAGARPVVTSRNPAETEARYGVETVPWGPRGMRASAGVDAAIVGPGGIVQDSSSIWSLPGNLAQPWRVRSRGAPVIGVGLGAEPLTRRVSRRLVRRVLRDSRVVVRDQGSREALEEAGVDATVDVDLVFRHPLPIPPRADHLTVAIGPQISSSAWMPAGWRLVADDPAEVAGAIDTLAGRLNASIHLVAFRGERDRSFARRLSPLLTTSSELVEGREAQVASVLSARALVTSRYHPLVLAGMSGTPAAVRSGQVKIHSLVDQLGSEATVMIRDWDELATCDLPSVYEPVPPGSVRGGPADEHALAIDDLVGRLIGSGVGALPGDLRSRRRGSH